MLPKQVISYSYHVTLAGYHVAIILPKQVFMYLSCYPSKYLCSYHVSHAGYYVATMLPKQAIM